MVKAKSTITPAFSKRLNLWKYKTGKSFSSKDDAAHDHPAIFPEALARDHILSWSNRGDTVLDPMMGSGTTGKMSVILEREFIGIDISSEYVELAQRRIDLAELPIFRNTDNGEARGAQQGVLL